MTCSICRRSKPERVEGLESSRIPVRSWLTEVIELFESQAIAKGISLRAEIAPSVPETIDGDSTRLRQILVNLIGNAVKFTDAGHVTISVAVLRSSKRGRTRGFCVEDTGIGIPAEELDRLFEPWRQVSGTGLRHVSTGPRASDRATARRCIGGTISAGGRTRAAARRSASRFRCPPKARFAATRSRARRARQNSASERRSMSSGA